MIIVYYRSTIVYYDWKIVVIYTTVTFALLVVQK